MCELTEPCGPFGPVPPNSRLSSLLWQSVQKICVPTSARRRQSHSHSACSPAGWAAAAGSIAVMRHRMARRCRRREFRNDVQRIRRRHHSHRRVSVDDQPLLAGARAVAAQTIFILIDRWNERGDAIERADAGRSRLRRTQCRRRRKLQFRIRGVRVVAIHASRMPVVVQHGGFGRIVKVISRGQRMARPSRLPP